MNAALLDGVRLRPRIAAYLADVLRRGGFDLDEFRLKMRGKDDELDEALIAWHSVALAFVEEAHAGLAASGTGSQVAPAPEVARRLWTVKDVRDAVNCSDRAVRDAAAKRRLRGDKDETGRWRFTEADVAAWKATRIGGRAA